MQMDGFVKVFIELNGKLTIQVHWMLLDNYLRDMYVRLHILSFSVSHSSSIILNKLRRRSKDTFDSVHLGWQTAREIVQAEDC